MKKLLLLHLTMLISLCALCQAPFATYKIQSNLSNKGASQLSDEKFAEEQLDELTKTDFFAHGNANLIFINDAKKLFPTVNGEVMNYKLRLWTKTDVNGNRKAHILPFNIITKLSGNYADSAAGVVNDATSVFGAPLTFRVTPAFELLTKNNKENKFFAGFNFDLRMLTIGNTINNKIETGWGGYSSFGLTYMGTGYAFEGDEDVDETKRYEGKWSISTMIYTFKSGGTFNDAVFGDYKAKALSGLEVLLRFKTNNDKDSKFNFLVGASNGFTKGAPNFHKWEFKIGIGN